MSIPSQHSILNRTIFIIFVLTFHSPLFATENNSDSLLENDLETVAETKIKTIVITAYRQETPLSKVSGGVTIIDSADIQASHASSLVDLLSTTPALNISQAGGLGGQTSFFVRGTESNHTAILINGQQQKLSLGSISLQYIDLNHIERIEIIRGAQSSLHGSDAIGGVINIITKQSGTGSSLTLENGSDKLQTLSASTSGSNYTVTLSSRKTEGIDALQADTQNDADEFLLESANAVYHFAINKNFLSSINISAQRGSAEYDNVNIDYPAPSFLPTQVASTLPYTEFKNHNIALNNEYIINDSWQAQLNLGESRNENREKDSLLPATGQYSIFTHQITTLKSQGELNEHFDLNIGVDLAKDTWEQQANFDKSLKNNALFTLLQFEQEKHLLGISARQDDNEQFGTHGTYRINYQFDLRPEFRPYASIGTGFKAPDFDELYSPWYIPNPDLEPETSTNSEIGLRSDSSLGQIQLSIFKNEIDDFIAYEVLDPILFTGRLANIESVDIKGLEISHQIQIEKFIINSNASYTKAINNETDTELLRRPRRLGNIQIDYDFGKVGVGKLKVGVGAHAESARFDIDAVTFATKTLPGHMLAHAKLAYQINEQTKVVAKANNLFNKNYQIVDGYNTQGASGSVAITTQF